MAVKVTERAELTAETDALKVALVAFDRTLTVEGTVTEELLLARFTVTPLPAAATFKVTVQASVPAPVSDALLQVRPVSIGMPVPVRVTVAELLPKELLARVSEPETAPAAVGSNCTVRVAVWFGASVSGNVAPETVKPDPLIVAESTVTDAVPVDVNVTDCVAGVLTDSLPKARLVVLIPKVGVPVPSCNAKDSATPLALADRTAVCAEAIVPTVAENPTLVAPDGTVMDAGTVTMLLLLVRTTRNPPPGAAAFRVTVQLSAPEADIDPFAQFRLLRTGMPVPLKATEAEVPVDELLVNASVPEAAPAAVGSNWIVSVAV